MKKHKLTSEFCETCEGTGTFEFHGKQVICDCPKGRELTRAALKDPDDTGGVILISDVTGGHVFVVSCSSEEHFSDQVAKCRAFGAKVETAPGDRRVVITRPRRKSDGLGRLTLDRQWVLRFVKIPPDARELVWQLGLVTGTTQHSP